jgi:hypothetical protein
LSSPSGRIQLSRYTRVSKIQELEPGEKRDQARLYNYRDFVIAIWEDPAIQVNRSQQATRAGARQGEGPGEALPVQGHII